MPHTYFPPSRWFCSQPAEKACLLPKPHSASHPLSRLRLPLHAAHRSPQRYPLLTAVIEAGLGRLDRVLIIEIFGP